MANATSRISKPLWHTVLATAMTLAAIAPAGADPASEQGSNPAAPIPIRIRLERAGHVTLVIDDASGRRVQNLVNGEFFEAGEHTLGWDGLNLGERQLVPRGAGAYRPVPSLVLPGEYRVHGLVRDPLHLAYEFTVYPNVGTPPWPTDLRNGAGGWLADHAVPHAAMFIPGSQTPSGEDQVVLASTVAEAAQAVAIVNLDGHKTAGLWRIGGHWTGATDLARDDGPQRNPGIYVYTLMGWKQDAVRGPDAARAAEIRITGFAKGDQVVNVAMVHPDLPPGKTWQDIAVGGIAVRDGLLVYSERLSGQLHFLDVRKVNARKEAQPLNAVDLPEARGLAFDAQGRLLAIVGTQVQRFDVTRDGDRVRLSAAQTLIAQGLDEPQRLALDTAGNLYVSDWGDSHQVKRFGADGSPLGAIGKPGRPAAGLYDAGHMNHPQGVTVDSRGQVWVAEKFRAPKRVSVWTTGGNLLRAAYGPPGYGGGGVIDPADPTRFYLDQGDGGVEFAVDWQAGTAAPRRIYRLAGDTPWYKPRWLGPMFPVTLQGRRYLTEDFSGPTSGHSLMTIWRDDEDRARPVVFAGPLQSWPHPADQGWLTQFPAFDPAAAEPANDAARRKRDRERWSITSSTLFCWTDLNGDQTPQPDELQVRSFRGDDRVGSFISTTMARDGALLMVHGKGVLRVPLGSIDSDGRPRYDLEQATPLLSGINTLSSSGGGQVLDAGDDAYIITGGPMVGVKHNEVVWQVHSQWPSLHAGHAAPPMPEYPGQLLATTRLLGPLVTPRQGDAGPLWAINSDKGVIYLLTADGLYLDTLGRYPRDGQRWNMPEHDRGLDLTGVNFHSEHFWPTINQLADGRIFLVAGKEHSSIVRLDGLDSVRRLPAQRLTVTPEQIRLAQDWHLAAAQRERESQSPQSLVVARCDQPITLDGNVSDWPALHWVTINTTTEQYGWGKPKQAPATVAALAVDDQNLYIAVRSVHLKLLDNEGDDPQTLFRTGGALDLRLATRPAEKPGSEPIEGDLRLLVTRRGDKPFAVIYRPLVPGTAAPIAFVSPIGTQTIDQISVISDAVGLASARQSIASTVDPQKQVPVEFHEIAIPLSTLGWNPATTPRTRGDIGVLLGRGGATVERTYWHNKAAGIVSDVPSEVKLMPEQWGPIEVK